MQKCTRREEAARKDVEVDLFKNRGQRRWSEKGKLQPIRKMMQEQEMLGVAGGHRESTALETTGR